MKATHKRDPQQDALIDDDENVMPKVGENQPILTKQVTRVPTEVPLSLPVQHNF